jgi:hypothetical protein
VFAPSSGAETHGPDPDEGEAVPTVWRVERDVLGRETRCVISHGSDYEAEEGARVEERYEGEVGVSTRNPGDAWARATARYVIRWPGIEVATEARLDFRSDAEAYHVVVVVIAEELGDGGSGRERRFDRRIPRQRA